MAGDHANDRVSLLLFSDVVELFIPPNTGQKHIRYLLEQLFSYTPKHKKTSVTAALEHIAKLNVKDAVVFLISDFIGPSFDKALGIVAKKYDTIAIRCLDKNELTMPRVGFLSLVDDETGVKATIDTRSRTSPINKYCNERLFKQNKIFSTSGVDLLDIKSTQPYVHDMVRFFKKRMLY